MPEVGEYLVEWFYDANARVRRVLEGVCAPIPPTEWVAWQQITGNIVYSWEFDILAAMDVAFCDETNKELDARRAAQAEEAERNAGKGK